MNINGNHKLLLKATGRQDDPYRFDTVALTPVDPQLVTLSATDGKVLVQRQERGEHEIGAQVLLPSETLARKNAKRLVVNGDKVTVLDSTGSFTCKAAEGKHPPVEPLLDKAVCNGTRYKAAIRLDPALLVRALQAMGKQEEVVLYLPHDGRKAMVIQAEEANTQVTALVMPRLQESGRHRARPKPCLACQNGGRRGH